MRSVKVSVSLQDELLADIDSTARRESRTRSELLREAARLYVERQRKWRDIFCFAEERAQGKKLTEDDVAAEIKAYRWEKTKGE
jgi:CopG family transcriptional regulator/antitoxin EndoAI